MHTAWLLPFGAVSGVVLGPVIGVSKLIVAFRRQGVGHYDTGPADHMNQSAGSDLRRSSVIGRIPRRAARIGIVTACLVVLTGSSVMNLAPAIASATGSSCHGEPMRVPGAAYVVAACLNDLTTTGTVASGHTDSTDWAGLEAPGTTTASGIPGVQLDGYFPDTSNTNATHGWHHDSQFVIRLPDIWNGGLVVAAPPSVRRQYANDRIISDRVLAAGYAYAATDKGNTGLTLFTDGRRPGDAIREWHDRYTQLTRAARRIVQVRYGRPPSHTYAAGLSIAGYLVEWQLEHHPDLYSGGVAWNAVLFTPTTSLLTTLPPALRAYPRYAAGEPGAFDAMVAAGYPAASAPLWATQYHTQWDLFMRLLREEIDPGYDGATLAGIPFCPEGTGAGCDTDYDLATRPRQVRRTIEALSLTGRIGRPLVSIHGTLDVLVPISRGSDVYAALVRRAGRSGLHRYFRIEGGSHTDGLVAVQPNLVRPMLPCFDAAFDAVVAWSERDVAPPADRTIQPATPGSAADCRL